MAEPNPAARPAATRSTLGKIIVSCGTKARKEQITWHWFLMKIHRQWN